MSPSRAVSVTGPALDAKAVVGGAVAALVIAVPAGVLAGVLDDRGDLDAESGWVFGFLAVIALGLGVGGYVAGRWQPSAPLANGALAALVALATVELYGIVRRLADGEDISWVGLAFTAALAAACGAVGSLVAAAGADRRRRRLIPSNTAP